MDERTKRMEWEREKLKWSYVGYNPLWITYWLKRLKKETK